MNGPSAKIFQRTREHGLGANHPHPDRPRLQHQHPVQSSQKMSSTGALCHPTLGMTANAADERGGKRSSIRIPCKRSAGGARLYGVLEHRGSAKASKNEMQTLPPRCCCSVVSGLVGLGGSHYCSRFSRMLAFDGNRCDPMFLPTSVRESKTQPAAVSGRVHSLPT